MRHHTLSTIIMRIDFSTSTFRRHNDTMRDQYGTHTTSVAKDKKKRFIVLNALCLNATGLHPETNADAKKKTPARQQRLLYSCRDAAPYHHQPNVPMKDVGIHGSTVALAMLSLDPKRRLCYHVLGALALREWLSTIPRLHIIAKVRRISLALDSAHVIWCCDRRKGEI